MRLFTAVYPPVTALDDLASTVDRLHVARAAEVGINARVTARPLWHLTLAFLGEVPDDRGTRARDALRAAVESLSGHPVVALCGGGRFGRGRFTILWVGLGGDVPGVSRIATAIRGELRRGRLPHDNRPFRPHLTLARPGDRLPAGDIAEDVSMLDAYRGPSFPVESVHLVRSHLGPKPVYESLAEFPLAAGPDKTVGGS